MRHYISTLERDTAPRLQGSYKQAVYGAIAMMR